MRAVRIPFERVAKVGWAGSTVSVRRATKKLKNYD